MKKSGMSSVRPATIYPESFARGEDEEPVLPIESCIRVLKYSVYVSVYVKSVPREKAVVGKKLTLDLQAYCEDTVACCMYCANSKKVVE